MAVPLSLDCYLIVIPFDLIAPCYNPFHLPALLKNSPLYLRPDVWEETIKIAMRMLSCRDYGEVLARAREVLYDHGITVQDSSQLHGVIDWLSDISATIRSLYQQLDGRPFRELAFHRLVMREALYLRITP